MKKLLLLAIIMAMFSTLNAQSWQEYQAHNHEGSAAGDYLGESSDDFTTWSGNTGTTEDAFIIDSVTTPSGSNCFLLTSTAQDIVWDLGLQESATFEIQFKYMVGVGKGGYFNFQKDTSPGVEWGGEIYFASDSTGYVSHASFDADEPFTFNNGEWISVHAVISMDIDHAWLWIGDMAQPIEWTWSDNSGSGDPGLNTLGGVNFYGAAPGTDETEYYVDDCTLNRLPAISRTYSSIEVGMPDQPAAQSMGWPWDTWSSDPGSAEDAMVSNAMNNGGLNSIYLNDAGTDLVYDLSNFDENRIELSFDIYVDASSGAYYNLMHVFDNVANDYEWALEVVFNGDGTANHNAGGADVAFDYNEDAWNRIEYVIDSENDWAQFWVNNNWVQGWQWSNQANGTDGTNALAVMDLFPAGSTNPSYYIDNISVQALSSAASFLCDFEDYNAFYNGEYFAQGSPFWSTWTNSPGSAEDSHITNEEYFSEPNSLHLEGGVGTDLVRVLGHPTEGTWVVDFQVMVPTGGNAYFNLLHLFDYGVNPTEWAMECYFNDDGSGSINAGGTGAATFDFTLDEWHAVNVYIDIDNNFARLSLNDEEVYSWPWDNTATGEGGANSLGAINFYPPDANSLYYIDDLSFCYAEAGLNVEESETSAFKMYPNPANDMLIIENDFENNLNITIYSVSGQEVLRVENVFNNGRITLPTSDLIDGVYLLQLGNENETTTKRLVIQH